MQSFVGSTPRRVTGAVDGASQLKKTIGVLIAQEVGQGSNLDQSLAALAERWNPLLDPSSRENLVADVDSLISDYLRPIRRNMQVTPPSRARISAMADQLSESPLLSRISKKEPLRRYILLGILKQLR